VIVVGRAIVIEQDNVDTDVLYPGAYLNIDDAEKMKAHLFEGLDPSLRDQFGGVTILVVGENFGTGSSREHVPQAMRASGVRCLVGKSFARIFYRNCINLGLPAVTCLEAVEAAEPGSSMSVDPATGEVRIGEKRFEAGPIPPFMLEMLDAGGLVAWGERRLAAT
jgi:3-isopropylmalate/(R)-2-methylmalate dehydratase small subunit